MRILFIEFSHRLLFTKAEFICTIWMDIMKSVRAGKRVIKYNYW